MAQPEDVLDFWFADAQLSPDATAVRNEFWFSANPEIDQQIWQFFGDVVNDAAAGLYDNWTDTAYGRLAMIILLDQFPRNIFRGTSEVYRHDELALACAGQGVTLGHLAGLTVPEQVFFLMPYQHAEDISVQRAGVKLMQSMVDGAPDEWREIATGYNDFAVAHHDIVAEYGRFPHRNSMLGRSSTEEEVSFLASGGETFGTAD